MVVATTAAVAAGGVAARRIDGGSEELLGGVFDGSEVATQSQSDDGSDDGHSLGASCRVKKWQRGGAAAVAAGIVHS